MSINYRDWDPKTGKVDIDIERPLAEGVKMMRDSSVSPRVYRPTSEVIDMTDPVVRAKYPYDPIPRARGKKK